MSGTTFVCNASSSGSGGSGVPAQPALADFITYAKVDAWAGLAADHPWTLCYKATRDNANPGFINFANYGASQFHANCDDRGATFFVAKTAGGRVFGGYTADAWRAGVTGDCNFRTDAGAFLFSMTNNVKHEQTGSFADTTTWDCGNSSPTFGRGFDFSTNLSTEASVTLGYSFACRVGEGGSRECIDDFAGRYYPVMVELEVYSAQ